MYQKVVHFIKYHNIVSIIFVICFFGFGVSFAVSPEVRDSVYSSTETVVSVDNSLVISADLDNFNFNLMISSITEDESNYYVVYSYQTLVIEDGFWQNREVEKTLTVSKEALGEKDLGLYLAQELGENIRYEMSYLKRVQKLEKEKGQSQKVVAVAYSGLIGKLLDPKEKVIEGYTPVIPEVVQEVPAPEESSPELAIVSDPYLESQETPAPETAPSQTEPSQEAPTSAEGEVGAPTPEVVGETVTEPATSTPEVLPGPEPEPATTTPEVIPEPEPEPATTTPEVIPEPEPEPEPATASPELDSSVVSPELNSNDDSDTLDSDLGEVGDATPEPEPATSTPEVIPEPDQAASTSPAQ